MSRALAAMLAAMLALALAGCEPPEPSEPLDSGNADELPPAPGDPDYVRDPALDVELESEADGALSHNTGVSCMRCHQPHGPGRGLFTAAGSVYRSDGEPATGGSVQLWTVGVGVGELVIELPIDAFGNFYTTADIGLPDVPVQPAIVDPDGVVVNQMGWTTESAACNHCHTPRVRVLMP
jgi:hypothetical protein